MGTALETQNFMPEMQSSKNYVPMSKTQSRIEWIDSAKAIGIFLVVLGHTSWFSRNYTSIIYSSHIPLFFFLSGFLFKLANSEDIRGFISKRFVSRFRPYIIVGLLTYCIWATRHLVKGYILNDPMFFENTVSIGYPLIGLFLGVREQGSLAMNPYLWFLPALFMVEVIYCCLNKYLDYIIILIISLILFIFSPIIYNFFTLKIFSIHIVIVSVYYYSLGKFFKNIDIKINTLTFIFCLVIGLYFSYINEASAIDDMKNHWYYLLSSTMLIFSILYISNLFANFRIIRYLGKKSMEVFLWQGAGFMFFGIIFYRVFRISAHGNILVSLLLAVCNISLLLFISYLLDRKNSGRLNKIRRNYLFI